MRCIDAYIDKMHQYLPRDIIEYIVKKHIFLPESIAIIKKQKKIKTLVHLQLLFVSNIIHIDDNYCIYINNNNIIIHNIHHPYSNTYHHTLYGPSQNVSDLTFVPSHLHTYDHSHANSHSHAYEHIASYNSTLLEQINANLEQVQNSLNTLNNFGTYDNTSNIIIHTNHQDMENVIFYVVYSVE